MENKNVGWLIIGVTLVIMFIIFLFNNAMKSIVKEGCPIIEEHGGSFCPAYGTINQQTYLSLAITGVLAIVGTFLIFSKPKERIVVRKVIDKKPEKEFDLNGLKDEEKRVFNFVKDGKAIFQAELIEKTGLGKAKMTRIIDRLEGKGLVERKRRGMTNVLVLKE